MKYSFKDRLDHIQRNKEVSKKYKDDNRFHPLNAISAAEVSGALLWAHRQGILGQGTEIIVLEGVGYVTSSFLRLVIQSTANPPEQIRPVSTYLNHAHFVTSIVYQMAPKSLIKLVDVSQLEMHFHPDYKHDPVFVSTRLSDIFPEKHLLLNWSGGRVPEERVQGIEGFFKERSGNFKDLLVNSVPNSARFSGDKEEDSVFNKTVLNVYPDHIILVRNVSPYGTLTVKPFNDLQSQRFLCTAGGDVLVLNHYDHIKTEHGTSMAAPMVLWAAALLMSKYPHLTPQDAGDILLASAEKNFWINSWQPEFIYDPRDFSDGILESLKKKIKGLKLEHFSPKVYGQGKLSLRRAFIYADVKMKYPEADKVVLNDLFRKAIIKEENRAALKIQKAVRNYMSRKDIKK